MQESPESLARDSIRAIESMLKDHDFSRLEDELSTIEAAVDDLTVAKNQAEGEHEEDEDFLVSEGYILKNGYWIKKDLEEATNEAAQRLQKTVAHDLKLPR